jgi:predicted secreted protein
MRTATFRSTLGAGLATLALLAAGCGDDDGDDDRAADDPSASTTANGAVTEGPVDTGGTPEGGTSARGATDDSTTGDSEAGFDTVVVGEPSLPITASVGQSIAVPLTSNPTTGYSWVVTDPGDTTVVEFVASSFESSDPDGDTDGAGGTETLVFQAMAPGETTIELAYVFEGDVPTTDASELLELTITVR